MAGNASKLGIISSALVLIGDAPINSLDDAGAGAITAATLYDSSLENLMTMHRWRFAIKQGQLSRLVAAPINDWTYQHQLPSDFLYLEKSTSYNFEIFGDKVYSNDKDVTIDYGFMADESDFPAWFVKTAEYLLASEFAIPVTGNAQKAQTYNAMFEKQYKRARNLDASERPNVEMQDSPLIHTFASIRS